MPGRSEKLTLGELEARVRTVLADLNRHTGYGGIFYPFRPDREIMIGPGACRFCRGCVLDERSGGFCRNTAGTSAIQGHAIGDVWYFRCWLGIDSFSLAIAPAGEVVGTIEVGGFLSPSQSRTAQESALSRLSSLDALDLFQDLFGALQAMREIEFDQVQAIAKFLMEATFSQGLNDASYFAVRQRVNDQQQRLAAKVQELGNRYRELPDALALLGQILRYLEEYDIQRARVALDDFLGNMLLAAGQSLETARSHVLMLISTLFSAPVRRQESWTARMQRYEEQLLELNQQSSLEDLCYWAENTLVEHHKAVNRFSEEEQGEPRLSDRLIEWLKNNFMENITISDASKALGYSSSTIVHTLKDETGRTFTQHLTAIRVSEAKRLLAYTTDNLGQIGYRCGFNDQSYFTKVFRREINLTPREFRKMLTRKLSDME
jgi:two-component system response regulator YesN